MRHRLRVLAAGAAALSLILGASALWGVVRCDDPFALVSVLRGDPLHVAERAIDAGEVAGRGRVEFQLTNLWGTPVTVVGLKSDCGCVSARQLPATIAPGENFSLGIEVFPGFASEPTYFKQPFTLITDRNGPRAVLLVTGAVGPIPETPIPIPDPSPPAARDREDPP